ncbi:aldo/keto reductase [Streptomyces bingchenggensis BCW-1]|uniref:Aldo/keto reductase n=2 Tax=Streptomyces TaxID=1883 RepID=D7BW47_STRBB|nr:aldo/keto reductase [Streptomyces bingchenggensis BCW-1]
MITSAGMATDTSNNYAGGHSETLLGQAIAENGGLEPGHILITKADADPSTQAFDRDRVWRSFEESKARLGLDRIPLLHLHDPYSVTVEAAFARHGAVQGMIELREQGLVDAIGIAAGPLSLMTRYVTSGIFDALLTHNRYTLIDRRAEPLISEAAQRGMGVFNAAPFGGGILAGQPGTRYAYRESPKPLLQWVTRLTDLCNRWEIPLAAAALHFSVRNPCIDSTVVGVSSPERIAELQHLQHLTVPEAFWTTLSELGTPPSTLND